MTSNNHLLWLLFRFFCPYNVPIIIVFLIQCGLLLQNRASAEIPAILKNGV